MAGCYKITTVFSHAQTVVLCVSCSTVLAQPTGGRARLTEGKDSVCVVCMYMWYKVYSRYQPNLLPVGMFLPLLITFVDSHKSLYTIRVDVHPCALPYTFALTHTQK